MNFLVGAASIFAVIGAGVYQIYLKAPIESLALFGRDINPLNNENCRIVEALPACEKVVLHAPTGLLFAACSTPESRVAWCPALEFLNASGRAEDWVGIYDPVKSSLRKLKMPGFTDPRGFNSHGMDVVPSSKNPSELFVYLVNQRPPLDGIASQKVDRPNPTVEIFRMSSINSDVLEHVRTVEHPLVRSPNDVVGSSDGTEFWATNDGSHTRGIATHIRVWFQTKDTSVTHCSVTEDGTTNCKVAIDNLAGANGIAREPGTDKFYVPDQIMPRVSVFERQADNTLVLSDEIKLPYPSDNVAVDQDGALWLASSPLAAHRSLKHFRHPEITTPSASTRVTINTGKSSFFGEKYKVQLVFEDGGLIASGATTTVYDAERGRLFLSGLSAPATICDLPKEKFDVESLAAAAAAN